MACRLSALRDEGPETDAENCRSQHSGNFTLPATPSQYRTIRQPNPIGDRDIKQAQIAENPPGRCIGRHLKQQYTILLERIVVDGVSHPAQLVRPIGFGVAQTGLEVRNDFWVKAVGR